jgi:hypothetical protein
VDSWSLRPFFWNRWWKYGKVLNGLEERSPAAGSMARLDLTGDQSRRPGSSGAPDPDWEVVER